MGKLLHLLFPVDLFTHPFMLHAFLSGTIVAILAGFVGFFVILRGSSFVIHVLPKVGFAGAAGAVLLGDNALLGLTVFSLAGASGISVLGKWGRHDVVVAMTLVAGLGVGALFLRLNDSYATGAYAMLFGQLVGVSVQRVFETAMIGIISLVLLVLLYRPLLFASIMKDGARVRGVPVVRLEILFLTVVALVTAVTVPVVGALLSFSLMIGPAATARYLTNQPGKALLSSGIIAVFTVWIALLLGYATNWPIGFFVSTITVITYTSVRLVSHHRCGH